MGQSSSEVEACGYGGCTKPCSSRSWFGMRHAIKRSAARGVLADKSVDLNSSKVAMAEPKDFFK